MPRPNRLGGVLVYGLFQAVIGLAGCRGEGSEGTLRDCFLPFPIVDDHSNYSNFLPPRIFHTINYTSRFLPFGETTHHAIFYQVTVPTLLHYYTTTLLHY